MVATLPPVAAPFLPPVEWAAARRGSEVLLTYRAVQAMMKAGIVPEDTSTELLHGVLTYTDKAATGSNPYAGRRPLDVSGRNGGELLEGAAHNYVVSALAELQQFINLPLRHVRTQSTLLCSELFAPIPDAIILRGPRTDYRGRLPVAADTFCVIEVADSSYERDAGEKLFGYARAGVPQYIIINLRNLTAEVHSNPDRSAGTYPPPQIVPSEGQLVIGVGENEAFGISLASLLP